MLFSHKVILSIIAGFSAVGGVYGLSKLVKNSVNNTEMNNNNISNEKEDKSKMRWGYIGSSIPNKK